MKKKILKKAIERYEVVGNHSDFKVTNQVGVEFVANTDVQLVGTDLHGNFVSHEGIQRSYLEKDEIAHITIQSRVKTYTYD